MGKGDVKVGGSPNVEGGDLDRHSRVLSAREGEHVDVVCNRL